MADNPLTLLALDLRRGAEQARRPPAEFMAALGREIALDGARNIREGITPDGGAVTPLAHPRPGGGGGPPRLNTGKLVNTLETGAISSSVVSGNEVTVVASTPGAALQQFGGLITPKRGQFLTIPLTAEAASYPARSFPGNLFALIRPGQASGVLAERVGSRGIKAHYALVKSVYVPPRPYLGFGQRLLSALDTIAIRFFGQALFGTQSPP